MEYSICHFLIDYDIIKIEPAYIIQCNPAGLPHYKLCLNGNSYKIL